jgi:hypothetical protein
MGQRTRNALPSGRVRPASPLQAARASRVPFFQRRCQLPLPVRDEKYTAEELNAADPWILTFNVNGEVCGMHKEGGPVVPPDEAVGKGNLFKVATLNAEEATELLQQLQAAERVHKENGTECAWGVNYPERGQRAGAGNSVKFASYKCAADMGNDEGNVAFAEGKEPVTAVCDALLRAARLGKRLDFEGDELFPAGLLEKVVRLVGRSGAAPAVKFVNINRQPQHTAAQAASSHFPIHADEPYWLLEYNMGDDGLGIVVATLIVDGVATVYLLSFDATFDNYVAVYKFTVSACEMWGMRGFARLGMVHAVFPTPASSISEHRWACNFRLGKHNIIEAVLIACFLYMSYKDYNDIEKAFVTIVKEIETMNIAINISTVSSITSEECATIIAKVTPVLIAYERLAPCGYVTPGIEKAMCQAAICYAVIVKGTPAHDDAAWEEALGVNEASVLALFRLWAMRDPDNPMLPDDPLPATELNKRISKAQQKGAKTRPANTRAMIAAASAAVVAISAAADASADAAKAATAANAAPGDVAANAAATAAATAATNADAAAAPVVAAYEALARPPARRPSHVGASSLDADAADDEDDVAAPAASDAPPAGGNLPAESEGAGEGGEVLGSGASPSPRRKRVRAGSAKSPTGGGQE